LRSGEESLQLQFELVNEGVQFVGLDYVASWCKMQYNRTMDENICGCGDVLRLEKMMGSGILIEKKAVQVE
jgi:hypothetical protein